MIDWNTETSDNPKTVSNCGIASKFQNILSQQLYRNENLTTKRIFQHQNAVFPTKHHCS